MLLGQLYLAEERGRNPRPALYCDTDRAEKCEWARGSKLYIITVRKRHVGGAGGRRI